MASTNHINIPDKDGLIYCCMRNKVVSLNAIQKKHYCSSCKMYNGDAKGAGVECLWEDMREAARKEIIVTSPNEEYASNQKRIIKTVFISKAPVFSA